MTPDACEESLTDYFGDVENQEDVDLLRDLGMQY